MIVKLTVPWVLKSIADYPFFGFLVSWLFFNIVPVLIKWGNGLSPIVTYQYSIIVSQIPYHSNSGVSWKTIFPRNNCSEFLRKIWTAWQWHLYHRPCIDRQNLSTNFDEIYGLYTLKGQRQILATNFNQQFRSKNVDQKNLN